MDPAAQHVNSPTQPPRAGGSLDALLVDVIPSMAVVLDARGHVIRMNRAAEQECGYSQQELQGRCAWEFFVDPQEIPTVVEAHHRALAGERVTAFEVNWMTRGGQRRRAIWSASLVRGDAPGDELLICCGHDVTERRQIEQRLRESEERYALALRGANDGIWDWDLRTDRIYYSARWKAILGYAENQVNDMPHEWLSRVHPDDLARLQQALTAHLQAQSPHVELEFRMRHRNGAWRWVLARGLAIRDAQGRAYRMAGSLTDIHDRKSVEEQLVRGALTDNLTGLSNRLLLESRLEHALARARRNPGFQFALLFLDLDRFKIINDGLGHMIGDRLLVEFSKRLASCVRPCDTVTRLGGDEFVILLEDMKDQTDATRVAQRLQDLLRDAFRLGEHEIFTTASIGIVAGSADYRCVADILRDADAAMYRAKAMGKSRYEVFDQALHEKAVETLKLETDLRRAIERSEFCLHFQPIVSLQDLSLRGFEALVRWRHPDRGMVSPGVFVPVMEETGLVVPLGAWVLEEACRWLADLHRRLPQLQHATISVNVSGKQFARPDLASQVDQILERSGLPASRLVLEITESVMMTGPEQIADTFARLRDRGVHFHVDDFGVGYSSLSQLHHLPIDGLKVDRSFVSRLNGDQQRRGVELIKTILSLAQNLGITVIAEGIETPLQLEQLKSLGCTLGQGYHFQRPVAAADIEAMLTGELPWLMRRAG